MDIPIVLAIDFDGTIAEASYPELGNPKPNVSYILKYLKWKGYYIIIWTCREDKDLDKIKEWCLLHDVPYDKINEHHPQLLECYKNDTRKICADIYIDDRCLFKLPNNWADIAQLILQRSRELQSKVLNYE